MTKLRFRITAIRFSDHEEVAEVTAAVRGDTLQVIKGLIGDDIHVANTRRHGTEFAIDLPIQQAMDLKAKTGRINGLDPRHEHAHEIWESLNWVYCSLIDE